MAPSLDLSETNMRTSLREMDGLSEVWLKIVDPLRFWIGQLSVGIFFKNNQNFGWLSKNSSYAASCTFAHCTHPCTFIAGRAMLRGSAVAPSGYEWHFQCSVGVDCSDAEPRCIWLAVLRSVSPRPSPQTTLMISPRRRGSRRLIQRHRLSWVIAFNRTHLCTCC